MQKCVLLVCLSTALMAESVAGLKWTSPADWKNEGSRPMRAATYAIAPAAGDAAGGNDAAECAVYFFGEGQGGSAEANVARWKGQLTNGGKPAPAEVKKLTVHGLPVTTVDVSGEYSGMGGPTAEQKTVKAGYRLLGAVVEGPGGNVYIKFSGPEKTVAANRKKFDQLIATFEAAK